MKQGRKVHTCVRQLFGMLAVTAMVVAAGCSSEPPSGASISREETTAASRSASPTPSPTKGAILSPSPKPTGDVEQQLHDATKAFYAAVTQGYQTLDPAPIKALVWPKTPAGDGYVKAINDLKSKGHRFAGEPRLTISNFRMAPQDADPNSETVFVTVTSSESTTVDRNGRVVGQHDGGSSNAKIQFMRMGDRWLVLSQRFQD